MAIDIFKIDDLETLRLKLLERYEYLAFCRAGHDASGYIHANAHVAELRELGNIGLIFANSADYLKRLPAIYFRLAAAGQRLIAQFADTDMASLYKNDYDRMTDGYSINYTMTAMIKKMNMEADLRYLRNFTVDAWRTRFPRADLTGNPDFRKYAEINLDFIDGALEHLTTIRAGLKEVFEVENETVTSNDTHTHSMVHWLSYSYGYRDWTIYHNKSHSYLNEAGETVSSTVDLGMDGWSGDGSQGGFGNWFGAPMWGEHFWKSLKFLEYKQVSEFAYSNATSFTYGKTAEESSSWHFMNTYHNRGHNAFFPCSQNFQYMNFRVKPISRLKLDTDIDYFLYCANNAGDHPPEPEKNETDSRERVPLDRHAVKRNTTLVPAESYGPVEIGNLVRAMNTPWTTRQVRPNVGKIRVLNSTDGVEDDSESLLAITGYHDVTVALGDTVLLKPKWSS